MQPYIFMEGRVKSFLLCLGDEELHTPSPPNTRSPDHALGCHGGHISCPLIFIMGQTPSEYSIPNWSGWMMG